MLFHSYHLVIAKNPYSFSYRIEQYNNSLITNVHRLY